MPGWERLPPGRSRWEPGRRSLTWPPRPLHCWWNDWCRSPQDPPCLGSCSSCWKGAFYICMLGLFGKHRAILQKTEQLSWWTKFKLHFRIRKEFDNNQNPPFPDGLLSPRPTRLHQLTTRFHNRLECGAFFLIAPFDSPANATHGGGVCKWDLI